MNICLTEDDWAVIVQRIAASIAAADRDPVNYTKRSLVVTGREDPRDVAALFRDSVESVIRSAERPPAYNCVNLEVHLTRDRLQRLARALNLPDPFEVAVGRAAAPRLFWETLVAAARLEPREEWDEDLGAADSEGGTND